MSAPHTYRQKAVHYSKQMLTFLRLRLLGLRLAGSLQCGICLPVFSNRQARTGHLKAFYG